MMARRLKCRQSIKLGLFLDFQVMPGVGFALRKKKRKRCNIRVSCQTRSLEMFVVWAAMVKVCIELVG